MKRHIDKWVLAGLAIGALMVVVLLAGPKLGLGQAYDFVMYRAFGLSRRGLVTLGVLVALAVPVARLVGAFTRTPAGKFVAQQPGRAVRATWAAVKSLMSMRMGTALGILAINLVVLAIVVLGVELIARLFFKEPDIYATTQPGQYFRFQPYLQSSNEGPLDHKGVWFDPLHNERIPFHVKSNSLGFRVDREFDTTTVYKKAPDERVVLIFGGSAVYGFGNTSNDTTGAGWLQRKLNEGQSKYRYKVFNMGNGDWVSYQQLIALNLYGLNLNPDWVIFMDARNDIFTLPGLAGDDVGFHFSTPALRNLVDGYYYRQRSVDFYRGSFENDLIQISAAYRFISGKQYVPSSQP